MPPNAKSAAGRLLRLPLKLIPRQTVLPVLSGINRGRRWIAGTHTHGCWIGIYEREKQRIVSELVKPGMNVFDLGANAGFYTLAFSRLVGSGHVWAIEPLPENVRVLERHLAMNRVSNVTIIQAAASDHEGMSPFAVGPSNAQGSLSATLTPMLVPTIELDSLPVVPDVVKIDIEGGELAALRGARRLIAARKTTWLVALDDQATATGCLELLHGYKVVEFESTEIIASPA